MRTSSQLDHPRLAAVTAWLPALAAALTAFAGMVNVASAVTPDVRWRGHLLLQIEGVETMRIFHALALPAGAALLLVSPYLLKRRRRALQVAIALLVTIGLVNLLKGLDYRGVPAELAGGATALSRPRAVLRRARAGHSEKRDLARPAGRGARGRAAELHGLDHQWPPEARLDRRRVHRTGALQARAAAL